MKGIGRQEIEGDGRGRESEREKRRFEGEEVELKRSGTKCDYYLSLLLELTLNGFVHLLLILL